MIADVQALTDNYENPEKVRENVLQVAYRLSCGGHRSEKEYHFYSIDDSANC